MPDMIQTQPIHIQWEGPRSVTEVDSLTTEEDFGVYQIYGGHPVYGTNALLYIGRASGQTFAGRIRQHKWWIDFNQDAGRVCVYVGKLSGYHGTPVDEVWNQLIDNAERLLIYACRPAYNSQGSGALDAALQNVHVLNWGSFCDLLPEVSGERWSSKYAHWDNYKAFRTSDPRG